MITRGTSIYVSGLISYSKKALVWLPKTCHLNETKRFSSPWKEFTMYKIPLTGSGTFNLPWHFKS